MEVILCSVLPESSPVTQITVDVVNPKAISVGELYGQFNPLTMDWRDGVGSSLMRRAATTGSKVSLVLFTKGPFKTARCALRYSIERRKFELNTAVLLKRLDSPFAKFKRNFDCVIKVVGVRASPLHT